MGARPAANVCIALELLGRQTGHQCYSAAKPDMDFQVGIPKGVWRCWVKTRGSRQWTINIQYLMIFHRIFVKDRNPRQNLVPFVVIKAYNRHRFGLSKTTRCLISSGTPTPKGSWKSNRILTFEQKGKREAFSFLALLCLRQSVTWWIWGGILVEQESFLWVSSCWYT